MPKFNFSESEKEALVTYLKYIDNTGYYPNYDADFNVNGWVELKYKNEK
jgi:nitric oxide reductase subunit C